MFVEKKCRHMRYFPSRVESSGPSDSPAWLGISSNATPLSALGLTGGAVPYRVFSYVYQRRGFFKDPQTFETWHSPAFLAVL